MGSLTESIALMRSRMGSRLRGIAERQPADANSPYWGESSARYHFALLHAQPGMASLDVACGTGYGLRLMAAEGVRAIGVDVDADATREASRQDAERRSVVLRGDGCRLPFPDATFSLITSFETIEHLRHRAAFVAELRRVLRPAGLFILSTPNANHTRPVDGKPENPFHVHEYTPDELTQELSRCFQHVQLLGQVLDGRFRTPPYWSDQRRLPRTLRVQSRLLARKLLHRMPATVRDPISQALWGHTFFPSRADYHFDMAAVGSAPNLLALCRP